MRKLIMWNMITLDGYFEGEEAWDLSVHELVWDKELEDFSIEQLKSADMLVFGENTYKGMAEQRLHEPFLDIRWESVLV